MPECFVAKATDLKDGDRRIVVSGKHEVGVFFKDGSYYAYSNYCLHAGGPACEGILVNKVVDIIAADRTWHVINRTFSRPKSRRIAVVTGTYTASSGLPRNPPPPFSFITPMTVNVMPLIRMGLLIGDCWSNRSFAVVAPRHATRFNPLTSAAVKKRPSVRGWFEIMG